MWFNKIEAVETSKHHWPPKQAKKSLAFASTRGPPWVFPGGVLKRDRRDRCDRREFATGMFEYQRRWKMQRQMDILRYLQRIWKATFFFWTVWLVWSHGKKVVRPNGKLQLTPSTWLQTIMQYLVNDSCCYWCHTKSPCDIMDMIEESVFRFLNLKLYMPRFKITCLCFFPLVRSKRAK